MSSRRLIVTAPSRLHFGLIGGQGGGGLGGAGLMIDQPATSIEFTDSARLVLEFPETPRAMQTIVAWHSMMAARSDGAFPARVDELPVRITWLQGPRPHTGLGSGTQMALSIAAGLCRWFLPNQPWGPQDVPAFGRRARSAVGSHGFFGGGFVVDAGKRSSHSLGELAKRIQLPTDWRIALVCPIEQVGLSGQKEEDLFGVLQPFPAAESRDLADLLFNEVVPSAEQGDFDRFSRALHDYGYRAGLAFGNFQSGPFHSDSIQSIVQYLCDAGIQGVGQSSWGPTVYAVVATADRAEGLLAQLRVEFPPDQFHTLVTEINTTGHVVSEKPHGANKMDLH